MLEGFFEFSSNSGLNEALIGSAFPMLMLIIMLVILTVKYNPFTNKKFIAGSFVQNYNQFNYKSKLISKTFLFIYTCSPLLWILWFNKPYFEMEYWEPFVFMLSFMLNILLISLAYFLVHKNEQEKFVKAVNDYFTLGYNITCKSNRRTYDKILAKTHVTKYIGEMIPKVRFSAIGNINGFSYRIDDIKIFTRTILLFKGIVLSVPETIFGTSKFKDMFEPLAVSKDLKNNWMNKLIAKLTFIKNKYYNYNGIVYMFIPVEEEEKDNKNDDYYSEFCIFLSEKYMTLMSKNIVDDIDIVKNILSA